MCLNCGCMVPEDDHGSEDNITSDDVIYAALENDQGINETIDNMVKTLNLYQSRLQGDSNG